MNFADFPRFSSVRLFTEPISDGPNTLRKGVSIHTCVRRGLWTGVDGHSLRWLVTWGGTRHAPVRTDGPGGMFLARMRCAVPLDGCRFRARCHALSVCLFATGLSGVVDYESMERKLLQPI